MLGFYASIGMLVQMRAASSKTTAVANAPQPSTPDYTTPLPKSSSIPSAVENPKECVQRPGRRRPAHIAQADGLRKQAAQLTHHPCPSPAPPHHPPTSYPPPFPAPQVGGLCVAAGRL